MLLVSGKLANEKVTVDGSHPRVHRGFISSSTKANSNPRNRLRPSFSSAVVEGSLTSSGLKKP